MEMENKDLNIYMLRMFQNLFRLIDKEINTGTDIIHVGSGKNNSVLDIIEALEKCWNKNLNKNFVDMRAGEHKVEINLDPRPLKKYLDYELQWNLMDGIKETIPYYEDQHNRIIKK